MEGQWKPGELAVPTDRPDQIECLHAEALPRNKLVQTLFEATQLKESSLRLQVPVPLNLCFNLLFLNVPSSAC